MPQLKSFEEFDLKGKRVIMAVDFNAPIDTKGVPEVADAYRLRHTIPTIEKLLNSGIHELILISHLGRPEGKPQPELSLRPIVRYFAKLMNGTIEEMTGLSELTTRLDAPSRTELQVLLEPHYRLHLKNERSIWVLENLRFHPGEETNDPRLVKALASLGDFFINEAFPKSHRAHASVTGLANALPHAAGLQLVKEVETLGRIAAAPARPFIIAMGGVKGETKIALIKKLMPLADRVLVGGALVNTALAARGIKIGKSLFEPELVKDTAEFTLNNPKVLLPKDIVVSKSKKGDLPQHTQKTSDVAQDEMILDIGPETIKEYAAEIKTAKTILWNGAMGYSETEAFALGSRGVARAITSSGAFSVIGGADTIAFVSHESILKKFSYVSTGGGAMLEFFAAGTLPGIEALA